MVHSVNTGLSLSARNRVVPEGEAVRHRCWPAEVVFSRISLLPRTHHGPCFFADAAPEAGSDWMTPGSTGRLGLRPRWLTAFSSTARSFPGNGQVVDPAYRHLTTTSFCTIEPVSPPDVQVSVQTHVNKQNKTPAQLDCTPNHRYIAQGEQGLVAPRHVLVAGRTKFRISQPAMWYLVGCVSNEPQTTANIPVAGS